MAERLKMGNYIGELKGEVIKETFGLDKMSTQEPCFAGLCLDSSMLHVLL